MFYSRFVSVLVFLHLSFIAISNYLVQIPFEFYGVHTTLGAFSFPLIFVLTDLTVRLLGAEVARQVIFKALIPALIISYVFSVLFYEGAFMGWAALTELNTFVARIALASLVAYFAGQFLDILVFNRLRQNSRWWLPPVLSTVIASMLDTLVFFALAFYASSDPYMAEHWLELATVDYLTKLVVSMALFIPLYGILLNTLKQKIHSHPTPV